jgi:hypothetical protein
VNGAYGYSQGVHDMLQLDYPRLRDLTRIRLDWNKVIICKLYK